MKWQEIRHHYPHQWLLVEAIGAYSQAGKRIVEDMTIVNTYPDAREAMHGYVKLHEQAPERELYVLHTDRESLDITERRWLGIRGHTLLETNAVIDLAQMEIYQPTPP